MPTMGKEAANPQHGADIGETPGKDPLQLPENEAPDTGDYDPRTQYYTMKTEDNRSQ